MAWSFGHSLILILALLVGLAAGWLLRGRLPGGATGPRSVTRSDIPHQAGSLAPVPVGDTPVTEAADAPTGTAVEEPADDNTNPVEEPAAPIVPAQPERVVPLEATTPMEPMEPAPDSAPTGTVGRSIETDSVEATSTEATPVPAAPVEETADRAAPTEIAPQPDAEPATVPVQSAADADTDDNLRRIDGIGPKIALALNAAGFRTYRQLAEATEPELRAAVRAANLRSAPGLSNWAQQARVLAEGGTPVTAGSVPPASDDPTAS